jgi:hypothetical protein
MNVVAVIVVLAIAGYVTCFWPVEKRTIEDELQELFPDAAYWPETVEAWPTDSLVLVAPDGEELELPIIEGFDAGAILTTISEIEAL